MVIEAPLVLSGTTGGSTQRVLFGEDAKDGTQEVIKGDRNGNIRFSNRHRAGANFIHDEQPGAI